MRSSAAGSSSRPRRLQRTGSFKFRGAYNRSRAADAARAAGVVAFSSGNHAQGVAEAAELLGCRPPSSCRPMRRRSSRQPPRLWRRGRDVRPRHEDREAIAARIAAGARRAWSCRPSTTRIIAGQGTAGLEVVEQLAARAHADGLLSTPRAAG